MVRDSAPPHSGDTKELDGFVRSINIRHNTADGWSHVVQLFLELVQLVVSQLYLLLDIFEEGRDQYIRVSV